MKDKYYIPKLSELFVGYECELHGRGEYATEFCGTQSMWEDRWLNPREDDTYGYKKVLTAVDIELVERGCYDWGIRTKYLTAEQIEAEGWTNKGEHDMGYFKRCLFEKGNYMLCLHLKEGNTPVISVAVLNFTKPMEWTDKLHEDVYLSFPERYKTIIPCPSINEFRKIMKLLKID